MTSLSVSYAPVWRDAKDRAVLGRHNSAWIVCEGATREVSYGRVQCPRWSTVNAVECLACHLLVTVVDERDPRLACSSAE